MRDYPTKKREAEFSRVENPREPRLKREKSGLVGGGIHEAPD